MGKRTCGEYATFRYTWPGQGESAVCVDCAQSLQTLAAAIGLPLQLIPINYRTIPAQDNPPTCQQQVEKHEEHSA